MTDPQPGASTPRDPFTRPRRNEGIAADRLRAPDLDADSPAEKDTLRYWLLIAALLSVLAPLGLTMRDETVARPSKLPLTAVERAHLPQMIDIPAGHDRQGGIAAFTLSRTEVTLEQFRSFVRQTGYRNPAWASVACLGTADKLSWDNPGYDQADTYPVVCVSARDAAAFTAWLSSETGRALRLPTEREWAYAAAAGATTRFWWGDHYQPELADCAGCTPRAAQRPTFVGTRPANAYGLLDVSGNVREWTCSLFAAADSAEASHCAPAFDEASNLVVRGGSWQEGQDALVLGHRQPFGAWHRNVWTGFRVAGPAHR